MMRSILGPHMAMLAMSMVTIGHTNPDDQAKIVNHPEPEPEEAETRQQRRGPRTCQGQRTPHMTPTPIPGDTPEAKHTDTLVAEGKKYPLGDSVWICTHMPECGPYFASAVEAEGEYGGEAVEFVRSDRIGQLEAENADLRAKLDEARSEAWEKGFSAGWENAGSCDDNPPNPYLTEQANIRSPVQSEIREPYEGEDGA